MQSLVFDRKGNMDENLQVIADLHDEVSVENCPSPITFGELRAEMRKRTQSSPDHHNDA